MIDLLFNPDVSWGLYFEKPCYKDFQKSGHSACSTPLLSRIPQQSINSPCLFIPIKGHRGLEPTQHALGRKAGKYPGEVASPSQGFHTDKHTHTHIDTYGRFTVLSSTDWHVFELWEESRAQRGSPHRHRESMQTPHRQDQACEFDLRSFCCEATLLTTDPHSWYWGNKSLILHMFWFFFSALYKLYFVSIKMRQQTGKMIGGPITGATKRQSCVFLFSS